MFRPLVQELRTAERLGLWAGTEREVQLDNREYSTNLIYSCSDKQSDSRDKEEAVASGLDSKGVNLEREGVGLGLQYNQPLKSVALETSAKWLTFCLALH